MTIRRKVITLWDLPIIVLVFDDREIGLIRVKHRNPAAPTA